MVKKLLVLMAASAIISLACITFLGMTGGFDAINSGPWNWGPWGDGRDGRDPGPETTRDLAYSGSPRLDIYYPAEITYTQGDQPRFTVTGPQRVLDQLRLENGELTSDNGPRFHWNRRNNGRLRIEITGPNLHEFSLSGAQRLTLRNFDQDELRIEASGAADVDGAGRARRLEAHISGAGHLDLADLSVNDAEVSISGAGDASLDARNSADVSISGAGHVRLKCRPPQMTPPHISGFGSVDDGPSCSDLPPPAAAAPPASSSEPAAPAAPAAPAPKSKV
jgi:hypothetical protein